MDLIKEMATRNYKKHLDELEKIYDACYEKNEKLQAENERLRGEHYKDEELARIKTELEDVRQAFKITENERRKIKDWKMKHENEKHGGYPARSGAIGGRYEYVFIPTSIGTAGVIRCCCGEEFAFREL